jgi:hypothetical protein
VKDRFGTFYTALFDATVAKNPGAVVTEYAWQATTCDPCPGPALNYNDFTLLGADVLTSTTQPAPQQPQMGRRGMGGMDFVLTRLHARYGKDITDDLRFKEATPIVGGREFVAGANGKLEEGAKPSTTNNFQGRYAIRHLWTGPISCDNPRRGVWGGPPSGGMAAGIKPALDLAFAPRGGVDLPAVVNRDVPEIGIKASEVVATPNPPADPGKPGKPASKDKKGGGCCDAGDAAGGSIVLGLLVGLVIRRRAK